MIVVVDDGFVESLTGDEEWFGVGDAETGFDFAAAFCRFQNFHENFQVFFTVW